MNRLDRCRQLAGKCLAFAVAVGAFALFLAACQAAAPAVPAPATGAAGAPPVISVTVTGHGITMPLEIPAGPVTFAYQLSALAPDLPEFSRLNTGVTLDKLLAAMQENSLAAMPMISLLGRSRTAVDNRITYDLKPGDYVGMLYGERGAPPFTVTFAVSSTVPPATPPTATVNVKLTDFRIDMPDTIPAGKQTWEIDNQGKQWHELAIIKLHEGVTVNDVFKQMQAADAGQALPFDMMAAWTPMGFGQRAWVTWDLPAGKYTVLCFLPDLNGDKAPHATKGEVHDLIVK